MVSDSLQPLGCGPPDSSVHGVLQQEHWSGLPFPSPVDHILSDLSTLTLCLGWPHTAWLSFTELDKAVVRVISWLVFCDYGFSVSALWCPLTTPTVLLGFLLPWTWGISSGLLQQSTPHGHPSWPWTWSSSSGPSYTYYIVKKLGLKQHIIIISQFVFNRNVALQIQTLTDCNQGILCL